MKQFKFKITYRDDHYNQYTVRGHIDGNDAQDALARIAANYGNQTGFTIKKFEEYFERYDGEQ